ncbi:MAG: cupin domain-containing protein [Chloroflexota bacterium]|nr:cupin domain-containing protein [Chloroflexota bacterium]
MARSRLRTWLALSAAILSVASVLAAAPATAATTGNQGVATTTLAEHLLETLAGARRWVLRDDHPLDGDAHGHASGFLYQVEAESVLAFEDGTEVTLRAGEAAWMPWGVDHLHRRPSGTRGGTDVAAEHVTGAGDGGGGPRIWAFLLETESESRRPGARWIAPDFRGLGDGAYTARLAREVFTPGAATSPRRHAGPELLYFQAGRWEIRDPAGRAVVDGERAILVDPRVPYALRNAGDQPAGLLRLSLVPTDRPPAEDLPPDALDE